MKKALQITSLLLFVCSFTSLASTAASLPAGNQGGQSSTPLLQNPANAATTVKPWKAKIKAGKIARQWKSMKKEFKQGDVSLNLLSLIFGFTALALMVVSLFLYSEFALALFFFALALAIAGLVTGIMGLVKDHPDKWMGITGIAVSGATIAIPVFIYILIFILFF